MPIEIRNDAAPTLVGNLAFQTGSNVYAARQRELANAQALNWAQLQQQDEAQQRQIAAQQQSQVYQDQAGLRDRMLGYGMQDYFGTKQFGQQQFLDVQNHEQQRELLDWRAAAEDRSWENRLNAEGKQKRAELASQRAAFEKYRDSGSMTPEQARLADNDLMQREFGMKDNPRFLMPDPPDIKEMVEKFTWTDEERGLDYTLSPDRTELRSAPNKKSQMAAAEAGRKFKVEEEAKQHAAEQKTKLQTAQLNAHAAALGKWEDRNYRAATTIYDKSKGEDGVPTKTFDEAYQEAQATSGPKPEPPTFRDGPSIIDSLPRKDDPLFAEIYDRNYAAETGKAWKDLTPEEKRDIRSHPDIQEQASSFIQEQQQRRQMAAAAKQAQAQYENYRRTSGQGAMLPPWEQVAPEIKQQMVDQVMGQAQQAAPQARSSQQNAEPQQPDTPEVAQAKQKVQAARAFYGTNSASFAKAKEELEAAQAEQAKQPSAQITAPAGSEQAASAALKAFRAIKAKYKDGQPWSPADIEEANRLRAIAHGSRLQPAG